MSPQEETAYSLGLKLAQAVSASFSHELSASQVKAMAKDILPCHPKLLDAVLYASSLPGFEALLSEPSNAIRYARKASLILSLEEIFHPSICSQLSSFLDGFIDLDRIGRVADNQAAIGSVEERCLATQDQSTFVDRSLEVGAFLSRMPGSSDPAEQAKRVSDVASEADCTRQNHQRVLTIVIASLFLTLAVYTINNKTEPASPNIKPEGKDCNPEIRNITSMSLTELRHFLSACS